MVKYFSGYDILSHHPLNHTWWPIWSLRGILMDAHQPQNHLGTISVLYSILVQLSICYSSNFLLGLSVVLVNDDHRCQIIPFCQHQWVGNYKNNTPRNHLHKRKVAHWPSSCPKRPMCNYIHPYKEHHNRTCNWHCVTVDRVRTSDQTARKGSRT